MGDYDFAHVHISDLAAPGISNSSKDSIAV
jgi:hypothetical protein